MNLAVKLTLQEIIKVRDGGIRKRRERKEYIF